MPSEQRELVRTYVESIKRCAALKDRADAAAASAREALESTQACWRNCRSVTPGAYVFPEYGVVVIVGGADYPSLVDVVDT